MEQNSNVIIIENVLQNNKVKSLADLTDEPKLFCKVFKEIFNLMKETLLSSSEEGIPTTTLVVIREDLFKLTKMLLMYYISDGFIDSLYPLKDLNDIVDAARAEIINAIDIKKASSTTRSRRIRNCRNKVIEALEMMKEFEARPI